MKRKCEPSIGAKTWGLAFVAKAFPTAEAVNDALLGLIALATSATGDKGRPVRRGKAGS